MELIEQLYDVRFSPRERVAKEKIWRALCEGFFQRFIGETDALLEVACGFGEFSRYIRAGRKVAVDVNPAVGAMLPPDVKFHRGSAEDIPLPSGSINVCFVSNFFEHLESKRQMDQVLLEILRVLAPGGRLIMMQPNLKYAPTAYWDYYDHHLPLSHISAAEGLAKNGYIVTKVIDRFVPFSTKSKYPKHPWLVRWYLRLPLVWRILGKQFVIIAQKPSA